MRRDTYLNVILTVNAMLLAGMLWTQVAEKPLLAETAIAQGSRNRVTIPNAANQRKLIADEIKKLNKSMEATRKLIESGKIKIEVTNLDQIKLSP